MSNYDEFDLDIIQTSPTGDGTGPDSVFSVLIVCSKPCLTETCTVDCTSKCTGETCGNGCQITTSITMR